MGPALPCLGVWLVTTQLILAFADRFSPRRPGALPFQLRARYDLGMVGKQYGLKVVHKPSNVVRSEKWFNTEMERTAAMSGATMERDYIYVLAEKDVETPTDVPGGAGAGS